MSRTVLFFGDSNTRGAGVGRETRFAALVEAELGGADGSWRFAVGHSESDFHLFPPRLDAALAKHSPDIVVLQCPTGPATYWINYPPWIRWFTSLSGTSFKWLMERYVRAYTQGNANDGQARRNALYEAKFLDPLFRWNAAQWAGARHLRRWFGKRYGTIVKATGPRYVQLMCRLRDRVQSQSSAQLLVLGLIPHSENYYHGYGKRAREFGELLAAVLHRPDERVVYLDMLEGMSKEDTSRLLISDGRHLSPLGHRRAAEIVAPALKRLMSEHDVRTGA